MRALLTILAIVVLVLPATADRLSPPATAAPTRRNGHETDRPVMRSPLRRRVIPRHRRQLGLDFPLRTRFLPPGNSLIEQTQNHAHQQQVLIQTQTRSFAQGNFHRANV